MSASPANSSASAQSAMDSDVAKGALPTLSGIEGGSLPHHLQPAPKMQVVFQDLKYSVQVKVPGAGRFSRGSMESRDILKGLSGIIQPARFTAVMGASGAGKTSFLNVMAGYVGPTVKVTGNILVNGEVVTSNKMRDISGFVHQEDVILDTMTVREALIFAAKLKLPSELPAVEKVARAMDVAALLNLNGTLDSIVGSAMIKGISGGEKRRLSLGMQMITNPSILFLDEPTSGLDTYTAYKVCKILSNVAHKHSRTIICTIHQPSSDIFHMFDDVIVLAAGQIMYHGEAEAMVGWFAGLGYSCPTYTNPADYLFMDILNATTKAGQSTYDLTGLDADEEEEEQAPGTSPAAAVAAAKDADAAAEAERIASLVSAWQQSPQVSNSQKVIDEKGYMSHGISSSAKQNVSPWYIQFGLLARRAGANALRNPLMLKGRVAQTIFLSLVIGLIYLRVDDDLRGVTDRQGSLFFIIVQGLFGAVLGVMTVFGGEKAVFKREYGSRMYSLGTYFTSRFAVQLPQQIAFPLLSCIIVYWLIGYQNQADKFWWFALTIILMDNCGAALGVFVSCLFNDIAVGLAVIPMFLLPLMVLSGFFVNSNTIPPYFSWIQWISPFRYGFRALAINEFTGLEINCSPDQNCKTGYDGADVLDLLGFNETIGQDCGILFAMMWGFLALAYLALWNAVRRLDK